MYPITLTKQLDDIEICGMRLGELERPDFMYPWEIIEWLRHSITQNLKLKSQNHNSKLKDLRLSNLRDDVSIEGKGAVWRGEDVRIESFVVFNTEHGEIIIDDEAHIYPFSYIEGPSYIGAHTEIKSHSQIRKNTSIGHHCKIGGEVSGSIIQPYTNKAHYGFVGDSYIGSWVNLGAGTSSSNLKNTYGLVRVEYNGKNIDTGMQFLGCIMGDYVKAAINTSIYTGKIIGVYAQLFGCVTENIGSFVMDTHEGKKEFELDAAIRAQKRIFERRGIDQTKDDMDLLKRVFEETKSEHVFIH